MPIRFTEEIAQAVLLSDRESAPVSALELEITKLFGEYRHPLFRYLLSLGLNPQDVEEIIQDVFLALFQHLRAGKPRDNLRGWIFRVGHNLGLKLRMRRPVLVEVDDHGIDPLPNPEQQALQSQKQRRIDAVIRALPEQDRACLSLRAEGFRYREIAEILSMSLGAVAQSLERSLGKLSRGGS